MFIYLLYPFFFPYSPPEFFPSPSFLKTITSILPTFTSNLFLFMYLSNSSTYMLLQKSIILTLPIYHCSSHLCIDQHLFKSPMNAANKVEQPCRRRRSLVHSPFSFTIFGSLYASFNALTNFLLTSDISIDSSCLENRKWFSNL